MRALWLTALLVLLPGCEQMMEDMYDQPKYEAYEPSALFADGMSARPLPPGTVPARSGALAGTSSGRTGTVPPLEKPVAVYPLGEDGRPLGPRDPTQDYRIPAAARPPVDAALLARGRERFEIFCLPCHGPLGFGDGPVVARGFPAPPSYHTPRLRRAPEQHFYDVISEGYGIMYSYASRVPPRDRWAITAYIRALQLSQHAPVADLPEQDRRRLEGDDAG